MNNNETLLGLPPIKSASGFDMRDMELALTQQEAAKNEIIRIGDDAMIFKANMDSISSRAINSIRSYNKIIQYASADYSELASNIIAISMDAKDTPHGKYVEEINEYFLQMAGQNNVLFVKMNGMKIGQELTQPLLPPIIQQQKQRGFLAKLLTD